MMICTRRRARSRARRGGRERWREAPKSTCTQISASGGLGHNGARIPGQIDRDIRGQRWFTEHVGAAGQALDAQLQAQRVWEERGAASTTKQSTTYVDPLLPIHTDLNPQKRGA